MAIRGGPAIRWRSVNRPLRRLSSQLITSLSERVLAALRRPSFSVSPRHVGGPPERRRRPSLHACAGDCRRVAPVLLLGGDQTQRTARARSSHARSSRPRATRCAASVTGRLVTPVESLVDELGLRGRVHVLGEYRPARRAVDLPASARAPAHQGQGSVPDARVEAMACGLPIVYPSSGGTVELVGDEAGIGVPHPDTWELDEPPLRRGVGRCSRARARAILRGYAAAARTRAVERFVARAVARAVTPSSSSSSRRDSRERVRAASRHGSAPSPCASDERDACRRRAESSCGRARGG